MPVTGDKRRSFSAVVETMDIPDGGSMRIGITDDGQIKIGIDGRSYQLQSMFRGGNSERGVGGVILILTPDKKRR